MLHGFLASNSLIFIVHKHFIEQVYGFGGASVLVAVGNESFEGSLFRRLDELRDLLGEVELVSAQIFFKVVSSHYADNASHLVIVVTSLKEGVDVEKHSSEGTSQRPDIKRVVVLAVFHQEFRAFVISASDTYVILSVRLVKIGQSPVDNTEVSLLMVNNNIQGLDIAMHDSVAMSVVEGFQDFINVESDVQVVKRTRDLLGLDIRNIFKYKARSLRALFTNHVVQADDVRASV